MKFVDDDDDDDEMHSAYLQIAVACYNPVVAMETVQVAWHLTHIKLFTRSQCGCILWKIISDGPILMKLCQSVLFKTQWSMIRQRKQSLLPVFLSYMNYLSKIKQTAKYSVHDTNIDIE